MVYLKNLFSAVKNIFIVRSYCTDSLQKAIKSVAVQRYFDRLPDCASNNFAVEQFCTERREICSNLKSLSDLSKESCDAEFERMLREEKSDLEHKLSEVERKILCAVVPKQENSDEVIMEISAGVGGKEAMLFAGDLRAMYLGFVGFMNWALSCEELDVCNESGGVRHCALYIEGRDCLGYLSSESGVHRVQRVPTTEKNGRIHTSTVSVAVFPQPGRIEVQLDDKDLVVETKRSSGAGGQHVNKTESAVRITHLPTGLSVESQEDRSQIKNRKNALRKLCAKLYSLRQRELASGLEESRKSQVGTRARSEKIRTYNFPQDRITDHRLGLSLKDLEVVLRGGDRLYALIQQLVQFHEQQRFQAFLDALNNEKSV